MSNSSKSGAGFFLKTVFVLVVIVMAGTFSLVYLLYRGDGGPEVKDVLIPRGSTLHQVADRLEKEHVIRNAGLFKLFLRFTDGSHKLRAGEFRFKRDMRMIDALFVLYHDEPIVHQVTVPEGWTARQIAGILAQAGLGSEQRFVELTLSKEAAEKYHLNAPSLEGFLFPETYAFSKVDGEERIVDRMVQEFFKRFDKPLQEEAKKKGFTLEQLVTLASIVEKETGAGTERQLVASVFHNRLRKRMKLQSDPTIIYGLGQAYDGNIHKADILRPTPYNTYTIPALPPGPIASPGIAALMATLRPAQTNYLYFVSNNQGSHIFSETYDMHSRHVTTYQKGGATARAPKKKR